jgi:hypothetical protein
MSILKKIIIAAGRALGFYRPSRPEDIPKKLSEKALGEALREARLLHGQHRIIVSELQSGELPGLPRRADEP